MNYEYCVPYTDFKDGIYTSYTLPDSEVFPTKITTESLQLERLTESHLQPIYELTEQTPSSIFENCWWESHQNTKSLREHITTVNSEIENGERVEYVMYEENNTDSPIGVCHLSPDTLEGIGRLGIWLHPDYWGNEYAVEHTIASISILFEALDMPVVQAWCTIDNSNSQSTLEKSFGLLGGKCDGRIRRGYYEDRIVFSITKEEYYTQENSESIQTELSVLINN